jgi:hypothetical protein
VIGGRVLDTSALVAFATRGSVYVEALAWTAVEENLVLVVPSTAVAAAVAELSVQTEKDLPVLEVLLTLPGTVVDELTAARARTVGQLSGQLDGDQVAAHAVACARDRGWALVTGTPDRYERLGGLIEIEPLF